MQPSIYDYVSLNGNEVALKKALIPTTPLVDAGVLVASDSRGRPLVVVNPVNKCYALLNGAKLAETWSEISGSMRGYPATVVADHMGEGGYLPRYPEALAIQWKRFTLGDKYIEFRSTGEIRVRGYGGYATWRKAVYPKTLDVSSVTREDKQFFAGPDYLFRINDGKMIDRVSYGYDHFTFVEVK